jgi:hypothetical protein
LVVCTADRVLRKVVHVIHHGHHHMAALELLVDQCNGLDPKITL